MIMWLPFTKRHSGIQKRTSKAAIRHHHIIIQTSNLLAMDVVRVCMSHYYNSFVYMCRVRLCVRENKPTGTTNDDLLLRTTAARLINSIRFPQ